MLNLQRTLTSLRWNAAKSGKPASYGLTLKADMQRLGSAQGLERLGLVMRVWSLVSAALKSLRRYLGLFIRMVSEIHSCIDMAKLYFYVMAKVRILLIPEHRNSLLASLPAGSSAWRLLDRAIEARFSSALFDDKYELVCDEKDACVLLQTAQENCPTAVETIEAAIRQAQQKDS